MFRFINDKTNDTAIYVQNTDGKGKLVKKEESNPDIHYLSFSKDLEELKNLTADCNAILNYMFLYENMEQNCIDKFIEYLDFVKEKNIPFIYFQFGHGRCYEILRSYPELLKDLILVTFRNDIIWLKYFKNRSIELPKKIITCDNDLAMVHGIDFDSYKRFWVPAEKKIPKSIKFIGGSQTFKGCWKLRDLHRDYLRKEGFISSIEGISTSIGILKDILKIDGEDWMKKRILRDDLKLCVTKRDSHEILEDQTKMQRDNPVYVLPPYEYESGMKRLAETQFGFEFVQLPGLEGTVFENAMMEMIAVGTIPVFSKKWGEDFKIAGKPVIEYDHEEIGAVFIDEEDPDISEILKLASDPDLYDKYRVNAFNFYKKWLDVDIVNKKLLDKISKIL